MRLPLRACLIGLVGLVPSTLPTPAAGALELHPSLSEHAVLQRDRPVPVWGTAAPGAGVLVRLGDDAATAFADEAGRWRVELPPREASAVPVALEVIEQGGGSVQVRDLLVGDVWLASGQSNMWWPVSRSAGAAEAAALTDDALRELKVDTDWSDTPQTGFAGRWRVSGPAHTPDFSAVAFHFARELRRAVGVPIGIIHSSWGGTPAEAWTPRGVLAADPVTAPIVERLEAAQALERAGDASIAEAVAAWEARHAPGAPEASHHVEPVNSGLAGGYAEPGFDDSRWLPVDLPHLFDGMVKGGMADDAEAIDGVAWYRRTVALPPALHGRPLTLHLGTVDDADETYADGRRIGRTGVEVPKHWAVRRSYAVPAEATADGEVVLAVRVFDAFGSGGMTGAADRVRLTPPEGEAGAQNIANGWRVHVEHALAPLNRPVVHRPRPGGDKPHHHAGHIFNAMVHPLAGVPITGVIWYQGEANGGRAAQYRTLFPMLIRSWRDATARPDLPFIFAQLCAYKPPLGETFEDQAWAHLRDAQRHTADTVPHTGMAVTLDLADRDNPNDIHPKNKTDVGHRLARLALAGVYGHNVDARGPRFVDVRFVDGAALVLMDPRDGRLTTTDGRPPREFWIAAEGGPFVRAEAELVDGLIRVSAAGVAEPAAVRYAWALNPEGINLVDSSGLPAEPFRTDDRPDPTAGRR